MNGYVCEKSLLAKRNGMKIIDFAKKGNVVRFYLGKDDLIDWYGDDWNDLPYQHNAGAVYDEFVDGHKDIAFPFDSLILEPADDWNGSDYCKDDMKERRIPCIIVVPKALAENDWHDTFEYWKAADGVQKFYFGDEMNES